MAATVLFPVVVGAADSNWTQWAGPNLDLTVHNTGVFDGPSFGLERIWVRPLGSAYSGIAVVDGKLVTMFSDGASDLVAALDAATGAELWRYRIGPMYRGHDGSHDGPNSTPLVHDGRVYGLGPAGRLFALRLEDGMEIFAHEVAETLGARAPDHGFTTAPTLIDGVLAVETGGASGGSISAFHPESGALLWQVGDDRVDYQSPLGLDVAGKTVLVAVTNEGVLGLSPKTGDILFRHAHPQKASYVASQPVPLGGARFLVSGRFGSTVYQVERGAKSPGGFGLSEVWTSRGLQGSYTTPVPYEGRIYGYSSRFLTCVDAASGETLWKSRSPGPGTLILVDGHLVVLASSGDLVVAEASPDGFQPAVRRKVLDAGSLAAPSFVDGRFYVRSLAQIAAIRVVERSNSSDPGFGVTPETEVDVYGELAQFIAGVESAPTLEAKATKIAEFLDRQETFPIVEGDRWVHFVYQGEVDDLALLGNFFPEDEGEKVMERIEGTHFFYRSVEVAPAAHYIYRFRVFGEPTLDPRNPREVEGRLAPWSELAMPGWPEPKHIVAPVGPRGRLETFTWASDSLEVERDVQVYLPAGYDEGEEHYPLLVVNEGEEALRYGLMTNSLDNLVGDRVAPIVVAFVPSRGFREYASVVGLDGLTEAMMSELLPELRTIYRILDEPGAHAIMGTTFGATHAVYAALKHPETFGRVAVQSYYGYRSRARVAAMLELGRGAGLRAFVELNSNDAHFATWADAGEESRELVERLRAGGVEVSTLEVADGPDWSSWRSRTDTLLAFLFPRE